MANLFGAGTNAKTVTEYTGLQLQTSAQGLCIPILWGANVLAPNLIWQNDFKASPANGKGSGGKGGGGKGASEYSYTEAVILALCEGPIADIGNVWSDGSLCSLATVNLSLFYGTQSQAPPSWVTSNYPDQARSYAYTAYLFSSYYQLSGGATLPSLKLEVKGIFAESNGAFGIQTSAETTSGNVLYFSNTTGVYVGQPVVDDVGGNIPGGTLVQSFVANTSVTLTNDVLNTIPAGENIVFGFLDVNFAAIIEDYLTNTQYGIQGFPAATIDQDSLLQFDIYCQAQGLFGSPCLTSQEQGITTLQRWTALCNTWIFWSGNTLKFVPLGDQEITANGQTYVPNTQPIYNLTLDDFIFDAKNEAPVTVTRIDPADGYNRVELDIRDRANKYSDTPVYWEDQASIDQFGVLQSNTISAPEICDVGIATTMATLIGQRTVFLRNTYAFKLPSTFLLLETGDIVTITEPNLGLNQFPVRIKTVDEDDQMILSFTAEEFPGTVGVALYARPQQAGSGVAGANLLAEPGNVNPPAITEPGPTVTAGVPEVWIGLSGGANWGGANVFLSVDGVNYVQIGQITQPTQQGLLTADLPSHADPDTANTLAVNLTESLSTLATGVTSADADADRTASLVGSEIISYGTVTPTGSYEADLTYLRRGVYGTTIADHPIGTSFSRINPAAVLSYVLPKAYVGVTLYFKFCSFNVFGGATQDISEVTEYTYVPVGVAYTIGPPLSATLTASSVLQPDGTTLAYMTLTWTASAGPLLGSYEVQFSQNAGATFTIDNTTGAASLSMTYGPALSNMPYQARVRAISQNGAAVSSWATSAVVYSATIPGAGSSAPLPAPLRRPAPPAAEESGSRRPRPGAPPVPVLVLTNGSADILAAGNPILIA